MLCIPTSPTTVMFAYNNKYFLIDMQQQNQLSQLDEKEAKQYQAIYKQCVDHCLDKSIEQLRTQNEKKTWGKLLLMPLLQES